LLSQEQELDLTGIAYHWRDAYAIVMSDGVWTAAPHGDPGTLLTANSADGLRELIRADYTRRTAKPSPLLGERMST
jgi:hypothetical protein